MQNIYKSIINTIPVFFFLWDRDKKETIFISEQFYDHRSGSYFSHKDAREDLRQYIHGDFQDVYDEFFRELSEENNFHNKVDLRAAGNLAEIRWVQLSTYPIIENGEQIKYISGHIRDITAEKEDYQVLEDQVKGLDTVLFLMAHELSAPTSNIIGLSEMLKYKSKSDAPENYLHFFDIISDLAGETQTITRALIGLIELQYNQEKIKTSPHSLAPLLKECTKILMFSKMHKPYTIDVEDLPAHLMVMVHDDQFSRAIEELLLYIQKYNKQQHNVKIYNQKRQNEHEIDIVIATKDISLPVESINRVLKHKERLELKDVKSNRFKGMLELIITKEILEKHSGKLALYEDHKAKGFVISLPTADSEQHKGQ